MSALGPAIGDMSGVVRSCGYTYMVKIGALGGAEIVVAVGHVVGLL